MRTLSLLRSAGSTPRHSPHPVENFGGLYPGIFIEPFAGGAGTSIIIVNGLTNGGLLIDQTPVVASFWREAIETCKISQRITSYMEMREKIGYDVANPERDPSFWACIGNPFYDGGNLTGKRLESGGSHWSIPKLVEFLEQFRVVSGRIKIIEGNASQLLDQYPEGSEEFAFFAAPYVECGRIQYNSRDFQHEWLEKALAGWKGRWLFSYDGQYELYSVIFLRRAMSKDCSGVAWMAPMNVNSRMP